VVVQYLEKPEPVTDEKKPEAEPKKPDSKKPETAAK
jgi:hypothetical protein